METQIRILAWLHIAMGVLLFAAGGLFLLAAVHGDGLPSNPLLAIDIVMASLPGLIGGYGLLRRRPWARTLLIIVGCWNLVQIPIGTLLGIYTLWLLTRPEVSRDLAVAPPSEKAAVSIAEPSRRTAAALLDILCISLLLMAMAHGLRFAGADDNDIIIAAVIAMLAYGFIEVLTGATLAKHLLRLQVRRPSGAPAPRPALAQRWLLKLVPIASGFAAGQLSITAPMAGVPQSQQALTQFGLLVFGGLLFGLALLDFAFSFDRSRMAVRDQLTGTVVANLVPVRA